MFQEERCCYSTFHKYTISRENWLSLVIQATWEARTEGWLEVEYFCYTGGWVSVAAEWLPSFGAVHRGGQTSYDEREARIPTATPDWPRVRAPVRPSSPNCIVL